MVDAIKKICQNHQKRMSTDPTYRKQIALALITIGTALAVAVSPLAFAFYEAAVTAYIAY